MEQLILFAEVSPVKTYPEQGSKEASLTQTETQQEVVYGMKCLELSTKQNQNMLLERTWQDCFRTMMEEPSMKLQKDWKIRVTKSCRYYLQHLTVVQHLRGKGFSSLPRPRVADTEGAPAKNSELSAGSWSRINAKGVRYGVKLKDVLYKLYGIKKPCPEIYEAIMGLPIGWTELKH